MKHLVWIFNTIQMHQEKLFHWFSTLQRHIIEPFWYIGIPSATLIKVYLSAIKTVTSINQHLFDPLRPFPFDYHFIYFAKISNSHSGMPNLEREIECDVHGLKHSCVLPNHQFYFYILAVSSALLCIYILCNLYNLVWIVCPQLGTMYRVIRSYQVIRDAILKSAILIATMFVCRKKCGALLQPTAAIAKALKQWPPPSPRSTRPTSLTQTTSWTCILMQGTKT